MKPWVEKLLELDSFTSEQAGKAANCHGPDAITRLRMVRGIKVEVIGSDNSPYKRLIYRIKKVEGLA